MKITQERLREVLNYDPTSGVFTWKLAISIRIQGRIGLPAGSPDRNGYPHIRIDGAKYPAHHLAWFWMRGVWPEGEIDHKDGDPTNYKIENLRPATRHQQGANSKRPSTNTSGFKGVTWHRAANKWAAQIHVCGKHKHLGLYENITDAASAYEAAAQQHFGEFAQVAR